MKKLAVIYHSGHGHTEHIALQVAEGARGVAGVQVHELKAEDAARAAEGLLAFDGLVFGSPTYLGGVSGPFKTFMDATGKLWRDLRLKGKLASGFTVSSLPAGDKQSTLLAKLFGRNSALALHRWAGEQEAARQLEGVE